MDLKAGQVVHAVAGERASYKTLQSPLGDGTDPANIVHGLLSLFPFTVLYIADLDAINGNGHNQDIVDTITGLYPELCIWLDAGLSGLSSETPGKRIRRVIGSETGLRYQDLIARKFAAEPIRSLDFRGSAFLGDAVLLAQPAAWPREGIAMTLGRVGTRHGPDMNRVRDIRRRAGSRQVYAAGGVRNIQDIGRLEAQGVAGVLTATALHRGEISSRDLEMYMPEQL